MSDQGWGQPQQPQQPPSQQPPAAPQQPPQWLLPPQQQQQAWAQQQGWGAQQGWAQPTTPTRPYAPTKKTEPAAVAAFVLSLCGLFTWGLSCVVALFLGPMAKRNIAIDPTNRKGNDLVLAAMIISGITIAIIVLITLSLAAA